MTPRFKQERPGNVDWTAHNQTNSQIATICIGELLKKAKHPGTPLEMVKDDFVVMRTSFPECPKSCPQNHKQMLTFLHDQKLLAETETVVYDMCAKCYTLYRGDAHDSSTCLNLACGVGRTPNTVVKVHYR